MDQTADPHAAPVPLDPVIDGFALGAWQTNCWLIGDRDAGTCVIVDPGQTGESVVAPKLLALGLRCEAILLTHAHLDHLWAAPHLARTLDVPVHLHPDDRWIWDDPGAGLGMPPGGLAAQFGIEWDPPTERLVDLRDGQRLLLAGCEITVRHTPGHTPGSSVFLLDGVLLSGDLLFAMSVGRSDLPGGSSADLMDSIARVVLPLSDETRVCCGHGPDTTVGTERFANPFLRSIA